MHTHFWVKRTGEDKSKPFTVFARFNGQRRDEAEYIQDYATRTEANQACAKLIEDSWRIEADSRNYASGYAYASGYHD